MANKKKKTGRPPRFVPDDIDELESHIEKYFKDCQGEALLTPDGVPMLDKWGNPVMIGVHPPTMTGLALAIGFNSRQSLLNYEQKPEFLDTITRAKARIEQYAEERLFDKDGANGAKFSLSNNFKGWKEKREIDADVKSETTIIIELVDDE